MKQINYVRNKLKGLSIVLLVSVLIAGSFVSVQADDTKSVSMWFSNQDLAQIVGEELISKNLISNIDDDVTQDLLNKVTVLIIRENAGINSLAEFEPLQGLKTLIIQNQDLQDFKGLDKLPNLENLSVTSSPIVSLDGLEAGVNLVDLSLGYDYDPNLYDSEDALDVIFSLTNLVFLSFRNGAIRSEHLEGIDALNKLQLLNLNDNLIENLDYITDLEKLSSLSLSNNSLNNIDGVEKLELLNSFEMGNDNPVLSNNGVLDYSSLVIKNDRRYLNLNVDRQAIKLNMDFDADNDLYYLDYSIIKSSSDTDRDEAIVLDEVSQVAVFDNQEKHRLEISAEDFNALEVNSKLAVFNLLDGYYNKLGRMFIFIDPSTLPVFYNVDFVSNGGSSVESLVGLKSGSLVTEPNEPTRDSYRFIGWYLDEALTQLWDFDEDVVTEDITLYADWEYIPSYYRVDFESNGGSLVESYENVVENSLIERPVDPTQDVFEFAGWYIDEAMTIAWNFDEDVVDRDIILYGAWRYSEIDDVEIDIPIEEEDVPDGDNLPDTGISSFIPYLGLISLGVGALLVLKREEDAE